MKRRLSRWFRPAPTRLPCHAIAGQCICYKAAGHVEMGDQVHGCDPTLCTGQWTGDFGAGDGSFRIVSFPFPVMPS